MVTCNIWCCISKDCLLGLSSSKPLRADWAIRSITKRLRKGNSAKCSPQQKAIDHSHEWCQSGPEFSVLSRRKKKKKFLKQENFPFTVRKYHLTKITFTLDIFKERMTYLLRTRCLSRYSIASVTTVEDRVGSGYFTNLKPKLY